MLMPTPIRKIDADTIEATKTTATVSVVNYRYRDLLKQRTEIQAQQLRDFEQRQIELAEVDDLLAACATVGVSGSR